MTDLTSAATDSTRQLPETGTYRLEHALTPSTQQDEAEERNPVFNSLVPNDGDIVGLVAYSIYKQNKHDWLLAFRKTKGRDPADAEISAYIIGESTPRRLAIYRHLAAATLAGSGPEVSAGPSSEAFAQRSLKAASRQTQPGSVTIAKVLSYVVLAVVVALAVLLAARYGLIPTNK